MLPIHISFQKLIGQYRQRINLLPVLPILAIFLFLCPSLSAFAQNGNADNELFATRQRIDFTRRPRYPTDPQCLYRTIMVDGKLQNGEWDPFYTKDDGAIRGSVYCHWDENYLYLAVHTDRPATVIFDVDMNGDGWLHGDDNLEVVVGSQINGIPSRSVRILDGLHNRDEPSWIEKTIDPADLPIVRTTRKRSEVIEIAIPKNLTQVKFKAGGKIGLRAEFLPLMPASEYVPTRPYEPHFLLDANLVETRIESFEGLTPNLKMSEKSYSPGEKLFATLEIINQNGVEAPVRSVLWSGSDGATDLLNTTREVSLHSIPARGRIHTTYNSLLPMSQATGSYSLHAIVEMGDGRMLKATRAFSIVEPASIKVAAEHQPYTLDSKNPISLLVDVYSSVPDHLSGTVVLTQYPDSWFLEGSRKRKVRVQGKYAHGFVQYQMRVPSNTAVGDYSVEVLLTWNERVWKARGIVHIEATTLSPMQIKGTKRDIPPANQPPLRRNRVRKQPQLPADTQPLPRT